MSFQVDAYLSNPKNWRKTGKKRYEIWCCKPPVGTKVHNRLENTDYVVKDDDTYVLSGFAGEQWCIGKASLFKKYSFPDGTPLGSADGTPSQAMASKLKAGSGCLEWFKVKSNSGNRNDAYACFLPAEYYKNFPVGSEKWGIFYANRPEVSHGKGDFLIASKLPNGAPDLESAYIVNGLVFTLTYYVRGLEKFLSDAVKNIDNAPKPAPLSMADNEQFILFRKIFGSEEYSVTFNAKGSTQDGSPVVAVYNCTAFGNKMQAKYTEGGKVLFNKPYISCFELYNDFGKVLERVDGTKSVGANVQINAYRAITDFGAADTFIEDGIAKVVAITYDKCKLKFELAGSVLNIVANKEGLTTEAGKFYSYKREKAFGHMSLGCCLDALSDVQFAYSDFERMAAERGYDIKMRLWHRIKREVREKYVLFAYRVKTPSVETVHLFYNDGSDSYLQTLGSEDKTMHATFKTNIPAAVESIVDYGVSLTVLQSYLKKMGIPYAKKIVSMGDVPAVPLVSVKLENGSSAYFVTNVEEVYTKMGMELDPIMQKAIGHPQMNASQASWTAVRMGTLAFFAKRGNGYCIIDILNTVMKDESAVEEGIKRLISEASGELNEV